MIQHMLRGLGKLRFRPKKLRTRFLLAMTILSIPPLFLLGFFSYNIAKNTLVQNHMQTNEVQLETASEVADLLFQDVINVNRALLADEELRWLLKWNGAAAEEARVRLTSRLQKVITANLNDASYIDSICVFDKDFHTVCYGPSDSAGLYGDEQVSRLISHTEWYNRALEARGKEVFFGCNVLEQSHSGDTFSSVKLIRNPEYVDDKPLGLLVVTIKKSLFDPVIHESDNSQFLVMAPSGEEVEPVIQRGDLLLDDFTGVRKLESMVEELQSSGYLVTRYLNRTTGWTFAHVMKSSELLRQSDQIGTVTAVIASVIALTALGLSLLISGSITRSLLQLKRMIVEWANGVRTSWTESFDTDEIGTIGETIKRMALENVELGERLLHSQLKEREAELNTLQAQIKPHFLYNTLDSIYWMAEMKQNYEVAQMAISLSESFKLSLNKGKESIPLFKELLHIEHYMTIQNIRYNNRFDYIQEIEEALMGVEILKLLLQPLVENAIYHGLEPKVGKGTVRLTGRREGNWITFRVEDNGVGIRNFESIERGYGLRNVRDRLALYYGPNTVFCVSSELNQGTVIELQFQLHGGRGGALVESGCV